MPGFFHDDILTSMICRRNPRIVNQATTTLRQCWPNPFSAEREGCSLQYYHSALYNICRCTLQKNKWQRVIETNNNSRNTMQPLRKTTKTNGIHATQPCTTHILHKAAKYVNLRHQVQWRPLQWKPQSPASPPSNTSPSGDLPCLLVVFAKIKRKQPVKLLMLLMMTRM